MTFRDNLKEIHERYGISYSFIADKTGISKSLITRYIKGDVEPSLKNVLKIVKKCPIDWQWEIDDCFIFRKITE